MLHVHTAAALTGGRRCRRPHDLRTHRRPRQRRCRGRHGSRGGTGGGGLDRGSPAARARRRDLRRLGSGSDPSRNRRIRYQSPHRRGDPARSRLAAGSGTTARRPLLPGRPPRYGVDRRAGRRHGCRRRRRDRRRGDRRRRRGLGLRWCGCGRRRGWRRGGDAPRRKQRQRVDVRLAPGTNPEVDVRDVVLGCPGRAGLGERVALDDGVSGRHEQRSEMRQRDLEAVRRLDRDGEAVRRDPPRKRDLTRGGSAYDASVAEGDVHAAVLAPGVRVVADGEAP
jgi:hypothetical protein